MSLDTESTKMDDHNMRLEERPIYQSPTEPPRKNYSDGEHWDIIVWYENSEFAKIVGFQIGYKEYPFNTDEESFLTLRPHIDGIEFGIISKGSEPAPAAKLIKRVDKLPDSFLKKVAPMISTLPTNIKSFLLARLENTI